MSDERPTGSRTARPEGGVGVSTVLGVIVAAIAVLLGFLILRDLDRDRSVDIGGGSVTPVESIPSETTPLDTGSTVPTESTTLPKTGYKVLVSNASGVTGSAGQMSTALQAQGFIVVTPATNAAETVGKQTVTVVYYVPGYESGAAAVAQVLGGVTTQVVATPPPVESGDLGEATVLVMLGTDLAGKLLPGALPTADPNVAVESTTTTVAG